MEQKTIPETIAEKKRVSQAQRMWKFIQQVSTTDINDLSKTAIIDGKRTYTYGLMFREWERYASVFSALDMTGETGARVGILGSTSAEVIFSVYGLNMVGAEVSLVPSYSALTPKRVLQTIRTERLTDFIVTDDFAQANLINDLLVRRRELGLNNIIVMHVPVTGPAVDPMLCAAQETKYGYLKSWFGPICMEYLLSAYENHPVRYAAEESGDTSVILHTSGTTSGTGKPVALSDKAINAAAAVFYKTEWLELPWDNLVTAVIVDLSNSYSLIDQVQVPFAMGAAVVLVPGGILNPWFYKAIPQYGISFLFTVSAMFERWIKMPDGKGLDFSSLRTVVLGGASVSAADKRRYYAFMREHGAGDITVLNGYGISELGGACCLSTPDLDDEAIGYPLPGVEVRLLDEDDGKYRSRRNAPCEGVLYLSSPSIAAASLDGEEILKTETINRKPYICTNDLVRMDETGKLTFLGRANRYFIHDEGKKYESGRVETEFSRQDGIESCGVVPVYVKTTHDNIPMLCVKVLEREEKPLEVVRKALRQVFITEQTLQPDNIPSRVMIARELPRNSNGKIDLYRISRGEVEGDTYTLETIRFMNRISDFMLVPYEEGPADMIKEVFDGISAEIKSNLPFNNTAKENKEENEMKTAKKAFEEFNAMNQMGMQMMKNMTSQFGKQDHGSVPFCGMPDMKKMMASMQQMSKMMGGKAPDFQQMSKMMGGKIPNVQGFVQNAAQTVVPDMQQQMNQMITCMSQMNQAALELMQKMFEQHCKMMEQFFDALQKMTAGPMAQAPAAPAEAQAPAAPAEAQAPAAPAEAQAPAAPAEAQPEAAEPETAPEAEAE